MLRRFWARAIQTTSLSFQRHFIDSFTVYVREVIEQALDRDRGHRRSINDHFGHRRNTSGAIPSMTISEIGMDLADEVAYHPAIKELNGFIADLVAIENVKPHGRYSLLSANELHRTCFHTTESRQWGMITTT